MADETSAQRRARLRLERGLIDQAEHDRQAARKLITSDDLMAQPIEWDKVPGNFQCF